jgi:hypothetical protein
VGVRLVCDFVLALGRVEFKLGAFADDDAGGGEGRKREEGMYGAGHGGK